MNKPHSDLRLKTILGHLRKNKYSLQSQHSTPFCSECSASTPLIQDKEYEYTHNSSHLSREQRQFYEENGYIIIKKLVNDDILDKCRDHFLAVCNGRSPAGGMFLMKEPTLQKVGATGEHLIYKIQDLLYDEVFSLYTTLPELLDYVQCFTGPNITAIHSMLINKPPDAQLTTIHPLHQDLLYFPFRPANLIVGTWTAMERIDQENGCLVVCPGSHRSNQLYQHGTEEFQTGPYKTFYGVKSKQKEQPIPLCMEKGDTVFLHPLIIHGSGPNRSRVFHRQYVWWNTVPILCRAPRSTASPPPTSPRLTTASPPPTTPRLTSASPPPPPPHHTTAPLPPTSTRLTSASPPPLQPHHTTAPLPPTSPRLTSASPPPPLPRHTTSPLPPPSSRLAIVPPPPPSPRLAIVPPPSPSTCLTTAPLLPSSPRLLLPILAASPGLNQNHPPPMVKIIHPTPHNSNISQFCTAH